MAAAVAAVHVFAGSCHTQPVSAGPGEIEMYRAELPVQREAVTGAADTMPGVPGSVCRSHPLVL